MRTFILLAALALPGCSLLGLDQLDYDECADDTGCSDLNTIFPTGDTCLTWQCNEASHHCEKLPVDNDDDGAPAMGCAPMGMQADCDDDNNRRFPGAPEVPACDMIDNNCDGIVDEGDYGDATALVAPTTAAETHYAQRPGENFVAATYIGAMDRPQVIELRDMSTVGPQEAIPVMFDLNLSLADQGRAGVVSRGSAIAALPTSGEFAFGYVESSGGCQRPLLGVMQNSTMIQRGMERIDAFPVYMDYAVYERGLPDDQGLGCVRTPCTPHQECRVGAAGVDRRHRCETADVAPPPRSGDCIRPCTGPMDCDRGDPGTPDDDEACVCPTTCDPGAKRCVNAVRAPVSRGACGPGMTCPAGQLCNGGNCYATCTDTSMCMGTETCSCPNTCVDTSKRCEATRGTCDPDVLCPAGETCEPDNMMGTTFHCVRPCGTPAECTTGEDCDMGQCVAPQQNSARNLEIATLGRAVLTSFQRFDATDSMFDSCAATEVAPLRLTYAFRDSRTPTPDGILLRIAPGPAVPFGDTHDNSPVGMVGVEGFGFIVAFVDLTNNIVFRHVRTTDVGGAMGQIDFELVTEPLLTIAPGAMGDPDGAERGQLSLTVGPTSGGQTILGLAYRAGCARNAEVLVRTLTLDTSAGTLMAAGAPVLVPDADRVAQENPSLAWSGDSMSWLVAYENANSSVRAVRLGFNSDMELFFPGEPAFVLLPETVETGTPMTNVSQQAFAFPVIGGDRNPFGVMGHLGNDGDETVGFYRSNVVCVEDEMTPDAGM